MRFSISINDIGKELLIKSTLKKYHFNDDNKDVLSRIYDEIAEKCEPYTIYRINHRTTGLRYIDESQTAACAITMGQAMDDILEGYKEERKLDEAYMADCLAGEILLHMYDVFNQEYSKFHRRYVNRYVFIGESIPLTNMQTILDDIYENKPVEEREIFANEYGVLMPSKSVVFYALLTDNPKQICAGICSNCGREDCEQSTVKSSITLNYGIQRILGNLKEVPNG